MLPLPAAGAGATGDTTMSSTQHQLIEQCATRLRGIVEALDNIHDTSPHRWSTDLDDVHSSAESLLALIKDQAPTQVAQDLAGAALAQAEQATADDYEEVLADHRRLVRELDVLLNGEEGAAKQASLCDLVGQVSAIVRERRVPLLSPSQAEAERLCEAYERGYGDGQNSPNGYSDKKERDACVNELLKQPSTVQAEAERPTYECTMGVGGGDGNLFVHGDRASIKAAQHIVLERDAALANVDALAVQVLKLGGTISFAHHRTDQAGQVPQAWLDVQAERRRQVEAEGWTPEHDDEHSHGQMARAAACYALAGSSAPNDGTAALLVSLAWPWDQQWWKPTSARRDLVKACALALAEIERLDRAGISQSPQPGATTASS